MVDMTGHRDHTMLDISVISAVQELGQAVQTRVLSIATVCGQKFVRSRACIRQGGVACPEEPQDSASPGEPIASYPALAHCLENHDSRAESAPSAGEDALHYLWLPVWFGDKAGTCLEIAHQGPFTPEAIHVISGIVSVYRNFQTLLDYSERDSLTGLLNRKTFDESFLKAVSELPMRALSDAAALDEAGQDRRHAAVHPRYWLGVIDIDLFKTINDRFGHLIGDEVLLLLSRLMRSSFRFNDLLYRFGGEEFVVLMRCEDEPDAAHAFERFRNNTAQYAFPQVGRITVSIGFTQIRGGDSPAAAFERADKAVYHAKGAGRNQVQSHATLVAQGAMSEAKHLSDVELF